jgi:hypothetical protein
MNEWHDFFIATAGASAALTGLIFVGVSINLSRILEVPKLPSRAFISLMLLLTILIVSLLLLVPSKSTESAALEILIIGLASWITLLKIDFGVLQKTQKQYRKLYLLNMTLNQVAVLPYVISGFYLLNGLDSGLYWLVLSVICSFLKATLDAWVLLIEINR